MDRFDFGNAYMNSLLISIVVTVAVVLIAGFAAYGMVRFRFDGEPQVPRDLGQDDGQQAQPAVPAAGDAPGGLHAEHRDDGREHRKHHARHDEAAEQPPQPEAEADQEPP